MQISHQKTFERLGKLNFLKTHVTHPPRGTFLDCNNQLLATDIPVFHFSWVGGGQRNISEEQLHSLKDIGSLLQIDLTEQTKMQKIQRAERNMSRVELAGNISYQTFCKISERYGGFKNIGMHTSFKRFYPHGTLASHILGYLGRDNATLSSGRSGLEKYFDQTLQGTPGYTHYITNAKGKRITSTDSKNAVPGANITLTLDLQLQRIAESLFEKDQSGAFILMDPSQGDIKALVSLPSFDPNLFVEPVSQETWQLLLGQDNPLLNRVTSAVYPPASLFKMVTFTAGLAQGIITPDSCFTCYGFRRLADQTFFCQRRLGHGRLTSVLSLAFSCNISCYRIAEQLSIDTLAYYASCFGLGKPTGFILPEKTGLIPTSQWKHSYLHQHWWKGETFSASIGQSYLLVTPMQIARMLGSIFTGYLVKPRLLKEEEIEYEPLPVSTSILNFLRHSLREVTRQGTGYPLNQLKNFTIFAKTGTAQTINLKRQLADKKHKEHGWFILYFYYKQHKPLVLVVLVEHAGSSQIARSIAKKFLQAYEKLYA